MRHVMASRRAHRFVRVDDVRLHFLEWESQGSVVVCLPGITANASSFSGIGDALSEQHRVLAIDIRGRGRSDLTSDGYDVAQHALDVAGILSALGIRQVNVVGWSLGAKIGLALAASRPGLVDRLA
ncbi:MAG: alpha/beta fold hydrolase, partial [Chloroflexi bacterium]|nr:alpha/beta fold hydrolase [Chloroflexota bacterium]